MVELSINVPEVRNFIKDLAHVPEKFFDMIRYNVQESVGKYLSALMDAELTFYLGRDRYERNEEGAVNYRNGSYHRHFTMKGVGGIRVKVPRDRNGDFRSSVIPQYRQYEDRIKEDLVLMYLSGVSTRNLELITKRLVGRTLSHGEVSNATGEMTAGIEKWRNRDLSRESFKYIFVDGVNFHMRIGESIDLVPVLVAIGVAEDGHKKVLGMQAGDKESASNWREFFKDLKRRGLDGSNVVLGIMDGLTALEKVFKEEFPHSRTQRCIVHIKRNILAKVARKDKKEVSDDLNSIFYASSKEKALGFYQLFQEKWEKTYPSAVKCLRRSIDSCLTFFNFPEEEWISLRTTNIIERLNKEFKRRTKPMEIVAGENACYKLLWFIALKMELAWQSAPVGKVNANLPFFHEMALREFTQKT